LTNEQKLADRHFTF